MGQCGGIRACRAHAVRITSRHSRSASPTNILLRLTYIKQQAPYPTLVEVVDRQAVFLRHDVKGTMLGYFSPVKHRLLALPMFDCRNAGLTSFLLRTIRCDIMTDMTSRRKTLKRDWFDNQPGAWVMVMLPAVAGFFIGGPNLDTLWLLATWAVCYCVQFSAAHWFKAHFSRRYLPPMLTYAVALIVIGLPFLITHTGILRWAPLYIVLVALSMLSSWLRKERSLWGNAVSVIAASAMATVIASFGSTVETACVMPINAAHASCAAADVTAARTAIRNMPDLSQIFDLHAWWPAGSLPVSGLIATVLFALTQYGSVLVVKTMIRERGKRSYVAASWVWHVALLLLAAVPSGRSPYLIAMTVLLLARAVALPVVTRRTTLKPVVTGITEAFASFIAFGCIIAAI